MGIPTISIKLRICKIKSIYLHKLKSFTTFVPYLIFRSRNILCGISTSVVHQLPKLRRRVRLPYAAQMQETTHHTVVSCICVLCKLWWLTLFYCYFKAVATLCTLVFNGCHKERTKHFSFRVIFYLNIPASQIILGCSPTITT